MKIDSKWGRRRGSTLVTVVVLVGALTVLTLVFLRVGARTTEEQLASIDNGRALYLAEAAITEAVESMRSGATGSVGASDDPAYLGGGVFWVEATNLGNNQTQLDAMAMKDGGRAALRVVVEQGAGGGGGPGGKGGSDGFFNMLFSHKGLQLDQSVMIDSYDSSLGTYASQATNTKDGFTYAGSAGGAASNAGIQIDSNAHIFGDVHTGPGYSASMSANAYVSGSTTPASKSIPLPQITVPSFGILLPLPYVVANNQTKTINSGNYQFSSMTMGKNSKLIIKGPATVVMSSFMTGMTATVEVDCKNGPVMVYDTGVWSVDKNFAIQPSTGSPVEAAFMITSTGTVQFDQGSKIKFGFYAPNATIQVDQGAEVWGALVADQINVDLGTHFHFDSNLSKIDLPWEIPDSYLGPGSDEIDVVSWSKIQFPGEHLRSDRRDPYSVLGVVKSELRSPSEAWVTEE